MASEQMLLIVPARGGSKGIPGKNLRMLNNKPLIAHVLETASQLEDILVVVSTEDPEIAEVAKGYGAIIVTRPAELSTDDATLDDAILHAWSEVETALNERFQLVVTVQPTSPLVSAKTIKAVITKVLNDDFDCCLSVKDARGLYWRQSGTDIQPAYEQRLNRQWLPLLWRETGAVVASRRKLLMRGVRIGGRIGIEPMPDEESVDIDTFDDWAVVEYRLSAPRVAFRVVGNQILGLGHVYRALSLARRMFTSNLIFAVDSNSNIAAQLIQRQNFPVAWVDSDAEFLELLRAGNFDLVINDILDTNADYIASLKEDEHRFIVNFEDLGSGAAVADLTFNALYEYSTPLPNQRFGWQYVCLRDEFLWLTPKCTPSDEARTIMITFGGTDPNNFTVQALKACAEAITLSDEVKVVVVVGPGNPRVESISMLVAALHGRFRDICVYRDVKHMSRLMQSADLAITSNGRTVFEFAAMGVPMITLSQNQREATHIFARLSGGAVDLGMGLHIENGHLASTISHLLRHPEELNAMSCALQRYDLRNGLARVATEILSAYKAWRNKYRGCRPCNALMNGASE